METSNKNKDLRELLNGRPLRLLIGGFPCTKFSIAQKAEDRETQPYSGEGWELFYNYLLAKEKFKPDFFLAENNQSIAQAIKDEVSKLLEVNYITIDSSLVSAQTRKRVYWTNIPGIEQPEDREILLKDIIESGIAERDKAFCLDASYYKGGNLKSYFIKHRRTQIFEKVPNGRQKVTVKNNIAIIDQNECKANLEDGTYYIRNLNVNEASKLQTMPGDYCDCVSKTNALKCLGNGWTAEVIIHILSYLDIPKDYPIEVLSMYDGIATSRYCLEKLGYTNITYKAYEIDEYAKKVAMKNYPDIIQCGDAFQLREDNWAY